MADSAPQLNPQHSKRRARRSALQALYQWQLSQQNLRDIEQQFLVDQDMSKVDVEYFRELLHKVPAQMESIDGMLKDFCDRPMEQIDPVERAILRIGAFELQFHPEIPYRVVLDESIKLAKQFGAEDGHKYINGILDKLAHRLRDIEIKAGF